MESVMGNCRKADVTFHRNGRIVISAMVTAMLGIEEGDVIDIIREKHGRDGDEYYLNVRLRQPKVGQYCGKVWKTNRRGRNLRTNAKILTDCVLSAFPGEEKIGICVGKPMSLEGYGTCLPLILRKIPTR